MANSRAKVLWASLAMLVVCMLVGFPSIMRMIGMPHNSRAVQTAIGDVRILYSAVKDYQRNHHAAYPKNLEGFAAKDVLSRYPSYSYQAAGSHDSPLIVLHNIANGRVEVWVTHDGRVFAGRRRVWGIVWPVYDQDKL